MGAASLEREVLNGKWTTGGENRQHRLPDTLAHQVLERIARLFKIEEQARVRSALRRKRARQVPTESSLRELQTWMHEPLTQAIGDCVHDWTALVRFVGDGCIETENIAAGVYTLIGTATLNGIHPQHHLRYVLERVAEHAINRIDELLPWVVVDQSAPDKRLVRAAQNLPLAS